MKPTNVVMFLVTFFAGARLAQAQTPNYDHVVIIVEENHGFSQIIGPSVDAPYINNTLATNGVLITNAYGEQHPSQPNYFWLFSGSNQGITKDTPYWNGAPGPAFGTGNLYTALQTKFPSTNFFGGYVDSGVTSAPITDFYADTTNYANRHVPWLGFTNINGGNPAGIAQDITAFPGATGSANTNYAALPKVSFITPALNHDMHDYDSNGNHPDKSDPGNVANSAIAVQKGDTWLSENLSGYAEWARTNNSLLIVTWDEDSTADWDTPQADNGNGLTGGTNPSGLTAPDLLFNGTNNSLDTTSGPNHIAMLFYGANLAAPGSHAEPGVGVNNINLLRTVESFYGLDPSGAQSELALGAGMNNNGITDIFSVPEPSTVLLFSGGSLFAILVIARRGRQNGGTSG